MPFIEQETGKLIYPNASIIKFPPFKNFSGTRGKYPGSTFSLIIDDPVLRDQLVDKKWNVRILAPRDEDEKPIHFLPVAIRFGGRKDPEIYVKPGGNGKYTRFYDDTIGELDNMDLSDIDIVVNPYYNADKDKVYGYLEVMYATKPTDYFYQKHQDDFNQTPSMEDDMPF